MFGTFNPGSATYEQCRPSAKTLAKGDPKRGYPGTGLSINTVRRALSELEDLGAIVGEPAYDARGGQLPNVYRLQFGTLHQPGGVPTSGQGGYPPVGRGGTHQWAGGVPTSGYQPISRYQDPNIEIPPSSSVGSSIPPFASGEEGGGKTDGEQTQPGDSGHRPAAEAIVDALPPVGRSRVGVTLRGKLVAGIVAKLADGWRPEDVTDELTRDLDTARTTGVFLHRMADMPTQPPRRRTPDTPRASLMPPKCGDDECDHKRQRHNADGLPYRCPKCHPLAVGRSHSAADGRTAPPEGQSTDARLSALLTAVGGSVRG